MATTRLVLGTTACLPACTQAELHGACAMISSPAWQDQHVLFRRSVRGEGRAAASQTTNGSSLAGGVKDNVSWLLGDQSWPGKISGPKPAEENLPACLSIFLSSVQPPFSYKRICAGRCAWNDPLGEQLITGGWQRGHGGV